MILDLAKTQARIYASILLVLCIAVPATGVWLYMRGQLSAQYALGKADATAESARADAQAIKDMLDKAAETQAKIDADARAAADALIARLATTRRTISIATTKLDDYARANPLPADCVAPPERVRLVNEGRQAGAP